jgi:enoyl-CoA hydratase/carnithine racemase
MAYRELSCQKAGHCMIVHFVSPMNVHGWTTRIANELEDLCAEVNWDEETRVIVLAYPGKIFHSTGQGVEWREVDHASLVTPVAQLKQPVIASVEGDAMGIGLELALACDIRIGTEDARFGLPHICDGLIPSAGGTQRLPRLIGPGKALEMILTGESVDAGEARRIGLFHRIVPAAELMGTAMALAEDMAARSPLAMSYVKEALHSGLDLTIDQGMRMELDLYLLLFTTQDRIEGITAFKEKRKPEFEGE